MTDEEKIDDLLLLWEEFYEQGKDLPAHELCRDFPEVAGQVAERIVALKRMNWLEQQNQKPGASHESAYAQMAHEGPPRGTTRKLAPGMEPIPGYRLIEKIGKGAFGEVWSASSGGTKYAIKFFHGDLNAPDARVRVERELEGLTMIKKVNHPLILTICSLVVQNDTLVLVTELADLSLEKLFTKIRDKVSIVRRCAYALCLLQNVAEALDHLHSRDLMHLDIKPANLLLVKGVCKIGDFGTVFHFRAKESATRDVLLSLPSSNDPDQIQTVRYGSCRAVPWEKVFRRDATLLTSEGVFTPYYAPPEAFRGKNSRSFDQYSLALTFCELVAGEIPFKSENQLAQRNEGRMELDFLPEPLRAPIAKALAPKASHRFLSCVAFINALYETLEPLVEEDKRNNNWEGWLLEMEAAAGTKSPEMQSDASVDGVRWKNPTIADKLFLMILVLVTVSVRWFTVIAHKVESVFWFVVPLKRNPNIIALLHFAAIVLICIILVSIHQNWFGGNRLHKDGNGQKDQKKHVAPHP